MPGPKFGTAGFLKAAEARWKSRRIELEYLLAELKAGRGLAELAPLIVNADIEKASLEESLGAGRQSEKLLRELLKSLGPDAAIERQTFDAVLAELAICSAIFRTLRKRIRDGEVFGPTDHPDARRRREETAKWRQWRRQTDARRKRGGEGEEDAG